MINDSPSLNLRRIKTGDGVITLVACFIWGFATLNKTLGV